ncbi:MAG: hypothetical protein KAS73_02085 [Candidatus Sabulitectum sp.]|nr:hypothetical protein [Candidatus Sabulitectum sp.]
MPVKKKKNAGLEPSRIVRSFVIVVVVAVLMGVSAKMVMNSLNKKMGLETEEIVSTSDTLVNEENMEAVVMPEFTSTPVLETGSSAWAPDWKTTPCSIFVSENSDAILDSLQESPGMGSRNTELQLLVEMWADYSGFEPVEIERIWVFASGDTCFVDLPRSGDWQGIVRTIEGRFISYTVLFPFVAGEILEGFEEGLPVRGVPSSR